MTSLIAPKLLQAATGCTAARAAEAAPHLSAACVQYRISTAARLAPFLGELAHESGSLGRLLEGVSGAAYEGRKDLGNTQPGDGPRFKGRGFIQLTGRANARAATQWLRAVGLHAPDFEAQPEALEDVRWASWAAAAFWHHNGLNAIADEGEGSWDDISSVINTGRRGRTANHLADRRIRRARAASAVAAFFASARQEDGETAQGNPAGEPALAVPEAPVAPAPAGVDGRGRGDPVDPPPQDAGAFTIPSEWDMQNPPQEPAMHPALTFVGGLASTLIDAFAPLAREKVRKELERHGADASVADEVNAKILDAAKRVTNLADPVAAVAAAKADPALVEQVQASALDELAKIGPLLDKLHQYDREALEATDASRDAAARRAAAMPAGTDQDPYLTRAVVRMMLGVMIGLALLAALLQYLGLDVQMIVGTLLTLAGVVATSYRDRYGHRYGSSSGSSAKDVTIEALAQQRQRK